MQITYDYIEDDNWFYRIEYLCGCVEVGKESLMSNGRKNLDDPICKLHSLRSVVIVRSRNYDRVKI